jgi:OmcA/MtrC family decaheme c-type cytochrome
MHRATPERMRIALLASILVIAACAAPTGPAGAPGTEGSGGSAGPAGSTGPAGATGPAGSSPWLTGPGVKVTITGAAIDATGATVAFKLTDSAGVALDRTGRLTTGKVNVSFVLAQLAENPDGSPAQYTAYTTDADSHAATEAIEANFAAADVTAGSYTYKLAAPLAGLDLAKTQTVLAVVARTVDGTLTFDRQIFSVRPSGGAPLARELVTTAACGSCHGTLALHGGRYTSPAQCVLCHQPQSTDPQSGNTVDFKVMIHKVHRGASLPSVVAGTPYQLSGFGGAVSDFSTVAFPQNIARCEACHAGAQGDRWKTGVSKAACASCHDTTAFTSAEAVNGKVLHLGVEQPTEEQCSACHGATAMIAPVQATHYTALLDPAATTVALEIQSITNTAPGQAPVVTFRVLVNGAPRNILTSPLSGLTATIAGPTTDIATSWQARIQGAAAVGTLTAVDGPNGVFSYTFPVSAWIPPSATGSYEVGLEGYLTPPVVPPATTAPRYAAFNPVLAFAVTDATPQPRRSIVAVEKCNGCHDAFAVHGGFRQNPQYCVFCHNTGGVDDRTARFESSSAFAEPLDFRVMIHKVHRGEQLTQPYAIGGDLPTVSNPAGAPTSFNGVRYPRSTGDCEACHASKNWTLPMDRSGSYAPSTASEMICSEDPAIDTNAFCDGASWAASSTTKIPPETSVCTSCHDAPAVAAHAATNTTASGAEACATCHAAGALYDVSLFHGLP